MAAWPSSDRGTEAAPKRTRRARLRVMSVLACTLSVIGVAACGGSSASSGKSSSATTATTATESLAIGVPAPPLNLNPVTGVPALYMYFDYDPLIYETAQGTLVPDLATSWHYVGAGNTTFELTLRPGVKFQDGSPLTASAVKASMQYFMRQPGPNAVNAGPVASVSAIGTSTLEIRYTRSFPSAPLSLSEDFAFGLPIGPKGLADPSSLSSTSDGTGQYELNPAASIPGSVYAYKANPSYWNPSAIRYKTIELRPYTSSSAMLAAAQSGQIQVALNIPSANAAAGQAAGLKIQIDPSAIQGLDLVDRGGVAARALADPSVRQAINYAIDRPLLVKSIYDGYATATDEMAAPGTPGYSSAAAGLYPYDPAKAKALLAAAGYSHGFTLDVIDAGVTDLNGVLGAALTSELADVGIHVNLNVANTNFGALTGDVLSKKYSGFIDPIFADTASPGDQYLLASQDLLPPNQIFNPFGTTNPTASGLLASAASAASAQQTADLDQLTDYLTTQAWFAPVTVIDSIDLLNSNVVAPAVARTATPNPVGPSQDLSWYTS